MALVGNRSVLNKSPGTWLPGSSTSHASGLGTNTANRPAFFKWTDWVHFNAVDQSGAATYVNMVRTAAKAPGYYDAGAWALPILAGEMAAWPSGVGSVGADLIPSYPMDADLTGSGSVTASASLVVSMIAALTGLGGLTATITGRLDMNAAITGSGSVTAAALTGIASLEGDLTGTGTITANVSAIASMEADIVSTGSVLTTANVGNAVWSALASANNTPGTMGEKLNDAGSAANPWTEAILSGSYAAGSAGSLLLRTYAVNWHASRTDPTTGEMEIANAGGFGGGVMFSAPVWNDADGLNAYDGTAGINRRDEFS